MTSVFRANAQTYNIEANTTNKGDLTVTGELVAQGSQSLTGKLNVLDTNDVDLQNPLLGDGALNVSGGAFIQNNLYVGGTLLVEGDVITLGNTGGSITFTSGINSDVIPAQDDTVNLGSSTHQWQSLYTDNVLLSQTSDIPSTANIDVDTAITELTSASSTTLSLPDGTNGQLKIVFAAENITSTQITPINALGFTSFSLTNAGSSVTLLYRDNLGWIILSNHMGNIIS